MLVIVDVLGEMTQNPARFAHAAGGNQDSWVLIRA